MTLFESFVAEMEKDAARRKRTGLVGLVPRALFGALIGGSAAAMSSPFSYLMLRRKMLPRREALLQSMLRVGERSTYGIPIGVAGSLATGGGGRKRKKRR